MAVRGKTVADAMEVINDLSTRFNIHVERQEKTNELTATRINDLEKEDIRKDAKIDAVGKDTSRILELMSQGHNTFREWFVAVTPWILIVFGLVYFYIKNGGL
jgi:hypothetical protein